MHITFNGTEYRLQDGIWFTGYEKAPQLVQDDLNKAAKDDFFEQEESLSDVADVIKASEIAEKRRDFIRALVLARRAYELANFKVGVAARVSNLFRKLGKSEEALQWTEPYSRTTHVPLLNTRSASFADIGEYLQAKKLAERSLAISPGNTEASALLKRIKSEYPGADYDLF